jgi:pimeloyl-ACP methyl ester carboxylesterase
LPHFDLLAFDFAACGRSEGQYVTLGYNEKEDVYSVLSKVRERYGVREVVVWGRSMGAATAIFYAAKYGGVKAVVSDSSFSDLEVLVNELSDDYIPFLPGFLVDSVIDSIQTHIEENVWKKEMTDFNIRKLKPLSVISKVKCPIFFIGSLQDSFVNVRHTKLLHERATSFKMIELVKGDHNDLRSTALKENILNFLTSLNSLPVKERISIFKNARDR